MALTAHWEWDVFSLDVKNAFLAGDISSRAQHLYMQIPHDLQEMLGLNKDTVHRLLKSAYGLAEAPIAWFKCLQQHLLQLGWRPHPLDECLMTLYDSAGSVCGLIGIHVDDLLVSGKGATFDKQMQTLDQGFPSARENTAILRIVGWS